MKNWIIQFPAPALSSELASLLFMEICQNYQRPDLVTWLAWLGVKILAEILINICIWGSVGEGGGGVGSYQNMVIQFSTTPALTWTPGASHHLLAGVRSVEGGRSPPHWTARPLPVSLSLPGLAGQRPQWARPEVQRDPASLTWNTGVWSVSSSDDDTGLHQLNIDLIIWFPRKKSEPFLCSLIGT